MFCPGCGEKLVDGAKFCGKCGRRIEVRPRGDAATPAAGPEGFPAQTGHTVLVSDQAPGASYQDAPVSDAYGAPYAQDQAYQADPKRISPFVPIALSVGALVAAIALFVLIVLPRLGRTSGGAGQGVTGVAGSTEGISVQALGRPTLLGDITAYQESDVVAQASYEEVKDDFSNVQNQQDYTYRIENEENFKKSLLENGFVIETMPGMSKYRREFWELYEDNRYNLIPNFVTTDSMMHTYHLYFAHLLKNCERTELNEAVAEMSRDMLSAANAQLEALKGTEWEEAAQLNAGFFGVACALMDGNAEVPASVSSAVSAELEAIYNADGLHESALFGENEDYSQYKPRGYYEGEDALERYFRVMMWYGRRNFAQKDETLDRCALLMTLALKEGRLEGWERVYTVTSFFAGASDDCGYYEYAPIIDEAYGEGATVESLIGNDGAWKRYHELTAEMPAPKINSVIVAADGSDHNELEKGYRFMGQRFSFDESIFQQLVYNKVGDDPSGNKRMLPDALDVPAAMGSDVALDILEDQGDTAYDGYEDNMQALREDLQNTDDTTWNANLYNQWLHTLQPLLTPKGEGYPSFMQSEAWARKDLVTYLGSYTELKHDTILYSKQIAVETGGGPIDPKDDRGYVEPEPVLFGRLAELTRATREGLEGYGMLPEGDAENLKILQDLAMQLYDIAEKELAEEALTEDEYELIRSYGGQLEHFWDEVYKDEGLEHYTTEDFPAAIVADVATDPNGSCLELGTGNPSTIYVLVEVDGALRIATGTVFSFYQFEQPISERLTDTAWRQMQGIEARDDGTYATPRVEVVPWSRDFTYTR